MKPLKVLEAENRINALIRKIERVDIDIELQAHWSRYLCILVSGYLEEAIRGVLSEHVRTRASPYLRNYIARRLEDFQNPKMEKIINLTGDFNPDWKKQLVDFIEEVTEAKDAVDSIVSNRHQIAHGRNVGISFGSLKSYYESCKKFVEKYAEIVP